MAPSEKETQVKQDEKPFASSTISRRERNTHR